MSWGADETCPGKTQCDGGLCVDLCAIAEQNASSVGCQYYAVDANNDPVENYDAQPFAVVVSNVDATNTAEVQVQTRSGNVWSTIQMASVTPGTLYQFNLPDRHVNYTNINPAGAYRIVSDVPIIAYQFQPVNGESSYTSDASLLLPTSALDNYYYIAGWGEPSFGNAQINIVATQDNTQVTFAPTTATVAGGPLPAYAANTSNMLPVLNEGDIIQIEANATFLGSYISSDKPVSVFSTHWCANVPNQVCCCDHLEEQVSGVQTWGKEFVASRLTVRNAANPEPTYWHVLASENATTVSFTASPDVTGLPMGPQMLNEGQALTLTVDGSVANPGDFLVSADKPIYMMQYLSSASAPGMAGVAGAQAGDPAMVQGVPVEQFRTNYVILVPANWVYDNLVITAATGETVTLDGTPIPDNAYVQVGPNWRVARVSTTDGVHSLNGTAPFSVLVLGFDSYDSYAYPGGLNQTVINPQ